MILSVLLQVKLPKEVAQAYALAQLQASEGDAERALSLFTATGTAVLVQGKLTTTPEGTKQVCPMLLLHHALSWLSFGPPVAAEAPVVVPALPMVCRSPSKPAPDQSPSVYLCLLGVLLPGPPAAKRCMHPHVRDLLQAVELKAEQVLYRGPCDNSKGKYPLSKKGHSMETLRAKLHLRPRTNIIAGGHAGGSRGSPCAVAHQQLFTSSCCYKVGAAALAAPAAAHAALVKVAASIAGSEKI